MVIVVPFEGVEDAEIFRYNLSHKVLHRYNPMPVAFSFLRPLFPVKPRSKILGKSLEEIPIPLS